MHARRLIALQRRALNLNHQPNRQEATEDVLILLIEIVLDLLLEIELDSPKEN